MHSFDTVPQYLLYKLKKDLCDDERYKVFVMFETSSLKEKPDLFEYNYGSYNVEIPNIYIHEFKRKLPFNISKDNSILFTWDDIIEKYKSMVYGERPYIGNCVYPLLELFRTLEDRQEHFDNFIFIEDDIIYTSNYKQLFDMIKVTEYDVVRWRFENAKNSWYWLQEYRKNGKDTLGSRKLTSGLLQLYSLSYAAMRFLYDEITSNQFLAHHELLVNTLLDNNDELTKNFYRFSILTHIYVYEHELVSHLFKDTVKPFALYHPIKQTKYLKQTFNI